MSFIKEFKEFAMKGNLIDLAIGFVMGAAFTKLTSAFIEGIVMPFISLVQGKDLSEWKYVLKTAEMAADGTETAAEVAVTYGSFITTFIEFILIAFVMFLVVKTVNRMKRKELKKPVEEAKVSPTDKLLMEIRDSLNR